MFSKARNQSSDKSWAVITLLGLMLILQSVAAMPPHPDLAERAANKTVSLPFFAANLDKMHQKGICTDRNPYLPGGIAVKVAPQGAPGASGPFKVLAILVTFSDHAASVGASFFDSLIYDSVGTTIRDYYNEISYGQLDIVTANLPTSTGWQTAPQTYSYYVNGQNGTGSYPQNSQKLVEDAVDLVDPLVDFSQYDNDGDGYVDVLLVIHAGSGAEYTGSSNDIWSHKWAITPRLRDGVSISDFTVQPEFWANPGDMTIGVYSHELAHGFGLPDLYDTDNSSYGIGRWGLMAYGSWNGPSGLGGSPSHPCAWSRIQMGFTSSTMVSSNVSMQRIIGVETSGEIYRLWNAGDSADEFFLVENRQKTGYDTYLPGSGLLIWHIDDTRTDNNSEWWPGRSAVDHYKVALEQADGLYELGQKNDQGDAADPFPGFTGNTDFNSVSSPNTDAYVVGPTNVAVTNVSASANQMWATLTVGLSAGIEPDGDDRSLPETLNLSQNYPNPFNPSTTIRFNVPEEGQVRVEVFNILGRRVATLLDEYLPTGEGSVVWDISERGGAALASGVYLYRLTVNQQQESRRMVLMK